jgi:hypothetical protein
VAIDVERILERPREALGKPLGVLITLRVGLQHHELVSAEPRDHVTWADDRLEPRRDLLEQFVANRVAERVVDRLEPVEVDARSVDFPI